MKYTLAIISIVLVVALTATVLSQGKRTECLQDCRAEGDYCAEKAHRTHAACTAEPTVCDAEKTAALRACQKFYDACRYACDIPRF